MLQDLLHKEGIAIHTSAKVIRIRSDRIRRGRLLRGQGKKEGSRLGKGLDGSGAAALGDKGFRVRESGSRRGQRRTHHRQRAHGDQRRWYLCQSGTSWEGACSPTLPWPRASALENAVGMVRAMDYTVVPRCVYSSPEVAGVGLTESEAKAKYGDKNVQVGRFPLVGNSKGVITDETSGMVKVIADAKYKQVLGLR